MIKISPEEMQIFGEYIHNISGVYLDQSKRYLIETRLKNLIEESRCPSFHELYRKAKADMTRSLERKMIDAICMGSTVQDMCLRSQLSLDVFRGPIGSNPQGAGVLRSADHDTGIIDIACPRVGISAAVIIKRDNFVGHGWLGLASIASTGLVRFSCLSVGEAQQADCQSYPDRLVPALHDDSPWRGAGPRDSLLMPHVRVRRPKARAFRREASE